MGARVAPWLAVAAWRVRDLGGTYQFAARTGHGWSSATRIRRGLTIPLVRLRSRTDTTQLASMFREVAGDAGL
jgi:hypothetical protein